MNADCLCGGIRIEVSGKVGPLVYCHCSRCRKASGTAFGANADVRRKYWRFLAGEDLLREFESSPGVFRAFCSRCGSPIYSRRAESPDVLRLRLGVLNDDPGRRSLAHFWVGSKAAWFDIGDTLPQFASGPAEHGQELAEKVSTPSRSADVFFYGLFMDQDLLRSMGLAPQRAGLASVDGLGLRIGQRAALIPSPGSRVHGVVLSLTLAELDRLYSEPSVQGYEPQAVLAHLASGGVVAALCYNLSQPPAPTERNPEYASKLRAVAEKVGLPADYVASLR